MEELPLTNNPFGTDQTWTDVTSHVARILRKKFRAIPPDLLQDVLSDVTLDLLSYWHDLPSSRRSDGHFSFKFALQRGCWVGMRQVLAAYRLNERESVLHFGMTGGDEDYITGDEEWDIADTAMGPEELALASEEQKIARQLLGELEPQELEDYFLLLSDKTQRQHAADLGISQPAVHYRQKAKWGKNPIEAATVDLRNRASRYGLAN